MGWVREATELLHKEVSGLDDREIVRPSLLPGWTRAHVVTHLARNADALVNLLTWARTGIEHPMYASRADRDADIEEGAQRLAQVIREDLLAACDRLDYAAERMTGADWHTQVATRTGRVLRASEIPMMRLFEINVHLVDLDLGVDFGDLPDHHLERMLDNAVDPHVQRTDGNPVDIRVTLPDGRQRSWRLLVPAAAVSELASEPSTSRRPEPARAAVPGADITGSAADMVAWLAGRGAGSRLTGAVPELPAWG
jgi:maleylpyruvate isomerase